MTCLTRAVVCLLLTFGLATPAVAAPSDNSARSRATTLLGRMTVAEKVGQLDQRFLDRGLPNIDQAVRDGRHGSFLYVSDTGYIGYLQHLAIEQSRLGIPLLFGIDVLSGYGTIFPAPIGLAASWDIDLIEQARAVAAREARAAGITWTFSPMVDIARDPRWGRMVEGAGEDPFLASAVAAAQVRGFQGPALGPRSLLATAKHFAGYGAVLGGRDYEEAGISENDLWNVYLPPFRAAIAAGVGSVMSSYVELNAVPAAGNRWLMQDVLRAALGFRGVVISDAHAIGSLVSQGVAVDDTQAAILAVRAGIAVDMESGTYAAQLPALVASGRVSEPQLDALVLPLLEAKFRLGLFEDPYPDESGREAIAGAPAHRDLARRAAERSAVLLKNAGLLPLRHSSTKKIAVIGPLGNSVQDTLGPWTTTADRAKTVTILDGMRAKTSCGRCVEFAPGVQISRKYPSEFDTFYGTKNEPWTVARAAAEFKDAVALARRSDVVVAVMGEAYNMAGENASRGTLALPGDQQRLLEALVATGKPVALVLVNGRPLDIEWAATHVPAILEAWYPGTEGGHAVANLLFGDVIPGGKLPFTWPRHVGQVPAFYSHYATMRGEEHERRTWDGPSTPLFPFGYGLSYARFGFSELRVSKSEIGRLESNTVRVKVRNLGSVAGDVVPQLYVRQRWGSSARPVRELRGFKRLRLDAGAETEVEFDLTPDHRTYWSSAERGWVQEASIFDIWVGESSTAELHSEFTVVP